MRGLRLCSFKQGSRLKVPILARANDFFHESYLSKCVVSYNRVYNSSLSSSTESLAVKMEMQGKDFTSSKKSNYRSKASTNNALKRFLLDDNYI